LIFIIFFVLAFRRDRGVAGKKSLIFIGRRSGNNFDVTFMALVVVGV
jgi:hypothetical protein